MSTTLSPVNVLTQLHIDTTYPLPDTARVAVVGEVDLATAPVLRDRLLNVLHDQAPAVLDVDLAGVTFLDCTGISALVAVRNAAVRTGRQMRVTHTQAIVRRVLDLTGLLGVLTAPIAREQPLTAGSEYPSRTRPVPAVVSQPPDLLVAA
jgi:anti-anti-sigma factor